VRYWGISALSHDAGLAVVEGDIVRFAAHSERFSRKKNDPGLHEGLLQEALTHGRPDVIVWYEKPLLKKVRHLRAGQWSDARATNDLPRRYLQSLGLPFAIPEIVFVSHHDSHAAGGFATSPFDEAVVIVADAIGEFRTFTIGYYDHTGRFTTLHERSYPHSLGLLYSAFTRRCGFRPNEDEYVVMGMAAFGRPAYVDAIRVDLVEVCPPSFRLKINPHRGIGDWLPHASPVDLAASVQAVTEDILLEAAQWAQRRTASRNLVLAGGTALNCVANSKIARLAGFDRLWIFPNPGDAGSSVGCVAAMTGRRITWTGPYLGTDIRGEYPVDYLLRALKSDGLVGVANGRAEFGPRALGNRSLLADPRADDMKDRVNQLKGREPFRPFAPVIRIERAHELFDLPVESAPYMQFTAECRFPKEFPAIVHGDGTSRVQTVDRAQHPGLYSLLECWEAATGCPLLLNTSLNSRGEPLLNSEYDVRRFSERTGLAVY
jgi:carbamoyltransferase